MQAQPLSPEQQVALEKAQRINDQLSMRGTLDDALAKSVVEGLEAWVQIAQTVGHPMQLPARHWVARLVNVLEQAKAATYGLQLANRLPGDSDGHP